MPENWPTFVQVKQWILDAAVDHGARMSVRQAKRLAGDYLAAGSADGYKRIGYADPVGEGVARRWAEFAHNMEERAAA